MVGILPFKNSS